MLWKFAAATNTSMNFHRNKMENLNKLLSFQHFVWQNLVFHLHSQKYASIHILLAISNDLVVLNIVFSKFFHFAFVVCCCALHYIQDTSFLTFDLIFFSLLQLQNKFIRLLF